MINADITTGVLLPTAATQAVARAACLQALQRALMDPAVWEVAGMGSVIQGTAVISRAVWDRARTTTVRAVGVPTKPVAVVTVIMAAAVEVIAPTRLALEAIVRMDIVRATPARTLPAAVVVALTLQAAEQLCMLTTAESVAGLSAL